MMVSATQALAVAIAAALTVTYSGKGGYVVKKLTEFAYGKPGCAPVGNVGNVTLHYFAGRGRGEAIRLLLEEAGMTWSEVNFDKETWPGYKEKGTASGLYTYGQVPAIETTVGINLVQSQAILHFLGRAAGMDCDCEDLHTCEVIALGAEDARSKLSRMIYDPAVTKKDFEHYLTTVMPLWLGHFEKLAPPLVTQSRAFFASNRLTWVDFIIYDLLETNIEFAKLDINKALSVDPLKDFPKLSNFYRHFSQRPRIVKHTRSDSRFPYKIPNVPKT